jgi:hypothetical protein
VPVASTTLSATTSPIVSTHTDESTTFETTVGTSTFVPSQSSGAAGDGNNGGDNNGDGNSGDGNNAGGNNGDGNNAGGNNGGDNNAGGNNGGDNADGNNADGNNNNNNEGSVCFPDANFLWHTSNQIHRPPNRSRLPFLPCWPPPVLLLPSFKSSPACKKMSGSGQIF